MTAVAEGVAASNPRDFDEEQAFLDIEAQLSGTLAQDESEEDESASRDDLHPLQLLLMQRLLSYLTSDSVEDEWKRRDDAVEAVVQYCDVLEGGLLRGRPKQSIPKSAVVDDPIQQTQNLSHMEDRTDNVPITARDKLFLERRKHLSKHPKPRACFQCFADESQPDDIRCRMFYDHGCVIRHFDARHLHQTPFKCNWCEVSFVHTMFFQRHVQDLHRLESRYRVPL